MKKVSVLLKGLGIIIIIILAVLLTNSGTVNKKDFNEKIIFSTYSDYEEDNFSQMFLDQEGNLSFYYMKYSTGLLPNEEYVYSIIEDEKWNPILSEKIKSYFPDMEEYTYWYESIEYSDNGNCNYIIYDLYERLSLHEIRNLSSWIMCLDENEDIIYNINFSQILGMTPINNNVSVMENGKICILQRVWQNEKAIIIDPYTESIVATFKYDFYPRMVAGDNLVGVNEQGNEVIVMNLSSGEIVNRISTKLNSEIKSSEGEYITHSYLDIFVYEDYIYMVNKNGIFITKLDGDEFENILSSIETEYLGEINKYEELLKLKFSNHTTKDLLDTNSINYEIYVKNQNEIYVKVELINGGGIGGARLYIKYDLK